MADNHPPIIEKDEQPIFSVGVIADTHIPDRVRELHPRLLPILREARVGHILHAGDISVPRVLDTLREVAPVTAVRGNRDLIFRRLPMSQSVELGGVTVLLLHGHSGLTTYLWDKVQFFLFGYKLDRYMNRLAQLRGPEQVIVFGHTHFPAAVQTGGRLVFNPGSASFGHNRGDSPTMGLLRFYSAQRVAAEVVPLLGYQIKKREWVEM